MQDIKPIPFFSDDIQVVPHTTSSDLGAQIGKPISVAEFSKITGKPVSLYETASGEFYLKCGQYPNITFVEGPERVAQAA